MRFRVRHVTKFAYREPAYESHNELRLKPRESAHQHTLVFRLEVTPAAAIIEYTDAFGNQAHAVSVHEAHRELEVSAYSLVERTAPPAIDGLKHPFGEFLQNDSLRAQEQYDFLNASRYVPFSDPLKKLFWMVHPRMEEPVAEYTRRIVAWVRDQFSYEPGTTHVHSDVNDILSTGAGVCQDFAHLTIGILRLAGVPARYVSGYLAPRGRTRPLGAQASHAWIEALLPEVGWVGFDPTHGCPTGDHHLRLGVGRDYADVPPLRGVYRSASMNHSMGVMLDIGESAEPDADPQDPGAIQQ